MKLDTHPKWCKTIRRQWKHAIHLYDPIFRVNFYFFLDQSFTQYKENYKAIFGAYPATDKNVSGFFSTEIKYDTPIGCIYADDKGRTLMHECLHAAVWATTMRGVQLNMDTDEVIAYYQEFLVKWATKK